MNNLLRLTRFLVLFLAAASSTDAQTNACSQGLVPLVAVGPDGRFLGPLKLSDVRVSTRSGGKVNATELRIDQRPRRIVILLDTSASMQGIWKVVSQFVRDLASPDLPNVRFALVLFSDHIIETTNFSEDRIAVDRRLKAISADANFMKREVRGPTAVYDAIDYGYKLLEHPTSADALLLITDGKDNRSKISDRDLRQELSRSPTRVLAILFDVAISIENRRVIRLDRGPLNLTDFVRNTGGDVLGPVAIDDHDHSFMVDKQRAKKPMPDELKEFYKEMLWSSVLEVEVQRLSSVPLRPDISLTHSGREKWKDATLYYPRLINWCQDAK